MQLALNPPTPLAALQSLFLEHGQPFTTSRAVAERFGKRHKNVIRDIDNLLTNCPDPAFARLNFEPTYFLDEWDREQPEYRLTHDGFAFLAMRFTGAEAMAWQIAFIQAFNALEAELRACVEREAAALHTLHPVTCTVAERPPAIRRIHSDLTFRLEGMTWFVPDTFFPGEEVICFPAPQGESLRLESRYGLKRSTWASPLHLHNFRRSGQPSDTQASSDTPTSAHAQSSSHPGQGNAPGCSPQTSATPPDSSHSHTPGTGAAARPAEPITIRLELEVRFVPLCRNPDSDRSSAS